MKGRFDQIVNVVETVPYIKRDKGLRDGEDPPVVVGGALPYMSTKQLVAWLRAVAARRPGVRKPFIHFSVRVQGESYSRRKWEIVCESCLVKLGLDPAVHPHVAVLHRERHEENCHVVVSRVSLTGDLFTPSWGVFAFIQVCQEVERELGLTLTPGLWGSTEDVDRPPRTASSHKVIALNRQARRLGLPLIDDDGVTEVIRHCASNAFDVQSFITLARDRRVDVVERFNSDGSVKGFAVKQVDRDRWLSMTAMTRREFSWGKIMKAFEVNILNAVNLDRAPAMSSMQDSNATRDGDVETFEVPAFGEHARNYAAHEEPPAAQIDADRDGRDRRSGMFDDVAAEHHDAKVEIGSFGSTGGTATARRDNAVAHGGDEASWASTSRLRNVGIPHSRDARAGNPGPSKMSPMAIRAAMLERAEDRGPNHLWALRYWKMAASESRQRRSSRIVRPRTSMLDAALDVDHPRAEDHGRSEMRGGQPERPWEDLRDGSDGAQQSASEAADALKVDDEFVGRNAGMAVVGAESVQRSGLFLEGVGDVEGRHFDGGHGVDVVGPVNSELPEAQSDRSRDVVRKARHIGVAGSSVEQVTVPAARDESRNSGVAENSISSSTGGETPGDQLDEREYEDDVCRRMGDGEDEEQDQEPDREQGESGPREGDRGTSEFLGDPDLLDEEPDGVDDAEQH